MTATQGMPACEGETTALLIIDVQQGLFHKSTPVYLADALLQTVEELIARAHAVGAPVIFIQHASDKVLPFGSEGWQIHPRLHPDAHDRIIHKQHGNAFEDTTLHAELTALGVGCLVAAGLVSHGCVKATCLGAMELGYTVILAKDGHSSFSKDAVRNIEECNRKMAETGAQVLPAEQITFSAWHLSAQVRRTLGQPDSAGQQGAGE